MVKIVPKFTVTPIDKNRSFRAKEYSVVFNYEDVELENGKVVKKKIPDSGRLECKDVVTHGGFLVKFPNGNSIRVESEAQMQRLGLSLNGGFVDGDTGDDIPVDENGNIDFRAMLARVGSISVGGLSDASILADAGVENEMETQ